jgi:hypothetical protein
VRDSKRSDNQDQAATNLPSDRLRFGWRINDDGNFARLDENLRVEDVERVTATWRRTAGATEINVLLPLPASTTTVPGQTVLRMITAAGSLNIEY